MGEAGGVVGGCGGFEGLAELADELVRSVSVGRLGWEDGGGLVGSQMGDGKLGGGVEKGLTAR